MTTRLGPVGPSSRMRRRTGMAYTEVAGSPVLCDPDSRSLHELSPAAAALWGQLDGRRLDALGDDEAGRWSQLEVVELVRRLRVLDLVEEVDHATDGSSEVGAGPEQPAAPLVAAAIREPVEPVELAGRVDEVAGHVVIVLSPWPPTRSVHFDPETSLVAGSGPVRALAAIDASGEPRRASPVEALRAIIGSAAPPALVAGPLDELAGMAETIPLLVVPDRSALSELVGEIGR